MTAIVCAVAMLFGAQAFNDEFAAATAAYNAGRYADAAQGYERLVASGAQSAEVFYDLGNAYYKAGRLGPAIGNFERAIALKPGLSAARENLEKAVAETANKLPKPLRPAWQQTLLFWDTGLGYGAVRLLAVILWLVFWAVAALQLIRRIPYGRSIAVLLCVLATLSGLSAWCKAHPVPLAVGLAMPNTAASPAPDALNPTTPDQSPDTKAAGTGKVPVRFGTSDTDQVRFELSEGDRVAVEERASNGWLRVRSVDGVRGWVREGQVFLVGPPYGPLPEIAEAGKKSS